MEAEDFPYPEVKDLHEKVKNLPYDDFKKSIEDCNDDYLLADLRYFYRYNPNDSRESDWRVRAINRLIKRREKMAVARREQIAIGLAFVALIVSALSLIISSSQ